MEWLIKGWLLGFTIAAPVGPIGLLCIRKTLTSGMKAGLMSGLGAATADALYGMAAGLGLSALTAFLLDYQMLLQTAGGLFLCYLGIKPFWRSSAPEWKGQEPSPEKGLLYSYLTTWLLTLSNPLTILAFLGVFSASGVLKEQAGSSIPFLVGGVFLGSLSWWVCLTGATAIFRLRLAAVPSRLKLVNQVSGLVILCFGMLALVQALFF
ncbi:LysE family translocator [Gorillibacterium sp. CAU 1737]|uniref:LysE family translocator n=1 Tax=Gorillibacterium sp. CAU 1737 TaxID=3140362 RepID=UPI0032605D79